MGILRRRKEQRAIELETEISALEMDRDAINWKIQSLKLQLKDLVK